MYSLQIIIYMGDQSVSHVLYAIDILLLSRQLLHYGGPLNMTQVLFHNVPC